MTAVAPWLTRPLAECGRLLSGGTPSKANSSYWGGPLPWFSSKEVKSFELSESELGVTQVGAENGANIVPAGSVLFVVRGMSLANEFRVGVTTVTATFNQDVKALVPAPDIHPRYLARCLRWLEPQVLALTEESSHGTKRLPGHVFENLAVPLPPMREQERIAAILDKADAVRRKRKEAIALTGELLRSAFLEMFGDPVTNPKGWPICPLEDLLGEALRNGLSPATGGTYSSSVLTLSAITRGRFDATAVKPGQFSVEPPVDVRLDARDFLICRGNGNKSMVGVGRFPSGSDLAIVFPDTMIAARVDARKILSAFLEQIWQTDLVRSQIERGARTTNGTFKINQAVVEGILIPLPPIAAQQRFGEVANKIQRIREKFERAEAETDALFSSLVHRAFRGEL